MNIKWTSKNVKMLGVFVGNDNPDIQTFDGIIPNFKKRLNYWKQFKISKIGKAAIVVFSL